VTYLSGVTKEDLYDHSLLRRIDFDEYGNDHGVDAIHPLYYFHSAIRNYLEDKVEANKHNLEEKYGE
jgi:hypothetical protein